MAPPQAPGKNVSPTLPDADVPAPNVEVPAAMPVIVAPKLIVLPAQATVGSTDAVAIAGTGLTVTATVLI